MGTREKILEAALELYNQHGAYAPYGEKSVKARGIAEKVGISDGNLRYHFAKKEDIIYGLYLALVEELNQGIGQAHLGTVDLRSLYGMMAHTYQTLYRYRFFMLDFVAIMRRIDKVSIHFKELVKFRQHQFKIIEEELIKNELFLPEKILGQYSVFYQQFQLMSDFWISGAEILYEGEEDQKVDYYVKLIFQAIIPYLTPKGLKEYFEIVNA